MKKHLMICALLFFTNAVYAKEDDCPSAVDAAEAQNPNAYKDCDYSQTGLNGVLHRALSKKKEAGEDASDDVAESKTNEANAVNSNKVANERKQKTVEKAPSGVGEFKTAQQLQAVKFNLLMSAATQCPKGFLLESERYLPLPDQVFKLELIYHCL